jgi:hypothetical protein
MEKENIYPMIQAILVVVLFGASAPFVSRTLSSAIVKLALYPK